MEDEVISVVGDSKQYNPIRLRSELIRQTFNLYLEKVKENPEMTINMSTYCQDVHFLLWLINIIGEDLAGVKEELKEQKDIIEIRRQNL